MENQFQQTARETLNAPTFDRASLVDLAGYTVSGADARARMRDFLEFVGNPYLFRVGEVGVHVEFSGKDGDSLQDHILKLLTSEL